MALLASDLAARGHEVWLLTLAPSAGDFYALDPRVHRLALGLEAPSAHLLTGLIANLRRVRTLRRALATAAPSTVLSFLTRTNVLALLACRGLDMRVVISERVDPDSHRDTWLWRVLRRLVYRRADVLVVQTEEIAAWFRRRALGGRRMVVIPNPVVVADPTLDPSVAPPPPPYVLGAGRLVRQKGFDLLIRAFATVLQDVPLLRLVIAGEGPEEQALNGLASSLGIANRVSFLGNVRSLSALMRGAEVFVLASRYEGFPNVLLEALACGLPTVAADCPHGPREILAGGRYGLLVPTDDVAALAMALLRVLTDPQLRQRLSATARSATTPYEKARVIDAWEALLAH